MLLYLIHYNNPEKTQYYIDEVDGEMQKDLIKLINSKTELPSERLQNLIEEIYKNKWNLFNVVDYCIKNDYYELLKQNQYLITKMIQERNCTRYDNKNNK